MPITINDTAFPSHPTPMFSALAIGDVFRFVGKYYVKTNGSQAFSYLDVAFVAIPEVECQPVTATLVITAP